MQHQGATEMAKVELLAAKQNLIEEEYEELLHYLKRTKGIPLDIKMSRNLK